MSIREEIDKMELTKTKRKLAFRDTVDAHLDSLVAELKEDLKAGFKGDSYQVSELRSLYYDMRSKYDGRKIFLFFPSKGKQKRTVSQWKRVLERCKEAGVAPRVFMVAQFDYFHSNFGTYPEFPHLTTENAALRAKEYKSRLDSGNKLGHNVVGAKRAPKLTAEVMQLSEQRMRSLCKAQNLSREEVYRKLVVTGLMRFPKEYLQADPVYRRVVSEG